ncbi:hypothetical protein NLJ89_g1806 [Agrocybe chaxingu]|uniref:Uncharacterized protein n=1 Tax=Agrocybe chaxingu TaxID=84603 RepID=A0A9W8MZB9_9AGAR|nr:hypothetical protein NLJ89_g1806 [Agrocybe chaxingu]
MNPSTHPEIEFRQAELVNTGPFIDSDGSTSGKTLVDLLEVYPDRTEWKSNLDHSELVNLVEVDAVGNLTKPPPLRIFFFDNLFFLSDHSYTEVNSTGYWMRQLCGVSPIFMSVATRRHGGVRGNGCFVRRDKDGKEISLDGVYHFSSGKDPATTVWFSHSLVEYQSSTYIMHKFPEDTKKSLLACAGSLLRPLAVDMILAECVLLRWEKDWERYVTSSKIILQGHLNDFQDTMQHLANVLQRRRSFLASGSGRLERWPDALNDNDPNDTDLDDSVGESLEFLQSRSDFIKRWVSIHRERVGIQINLFFNLANQLDSRTNLDIARLTSKISVSAQRDSSAMKTIAIVTMFFLPGTFVSSLFSMVFFDTQPDSSGRPLLLVGSQIWIYFVTTVVLTLLVLSVWGVWRYHRTKQQSVHLDVESFAVSVPAVNRSGTKMQLVVKKPE